MKDLLGMPMKYQGGVLEVLDQRMLPDQETWITCKHPSDMITCIKNLSVRGAPLIGCAAAASLALYAESGANKNQICEQAELLRASRPTAVNLMWAIDRVMAVLEEGSDRMAEVAVEIAEEDKIMCNKIARFGAELIKDGENIIHHCNTGGLATMGGGTALNVIGEAWRQGKKIHVYVDETRPLLQGGRLTTWELKKMGVPHTLICDNMAACLMRDGKVDRVILGADRITANGDVANKIGTYSLAVLAKYHNIPFHSVAPYSTFDSECESGEKIRIEQRDPNEVRGVLGSFGFVRWSPEDVPVFNPSFDWTPNSLITSIITDQGLKIASDWKQ